MGISTPDVPAPPPPPPPPPTVADPAVQKAGASARARAAGAAGYSSTIMTAMPAGYVPAQTTTAKLGGG